MICFLTQRYDVTTLDIMLKLHIWSAIELIWGDYIFISFSTILIRVTLLFNYLSDFYVELTDF
jgi:hypothetical protein